LRGQFSDAEENSLNLDAIVDKGNADTNARQTSHGEKVELQVVGLL